MKTTLTIRGGITARNMTNGTGTHVGSSSNTVVMIKGSGREDCWWKKFIPKSLQPLPTTDINIG